MGVLKGLVIGLGLTIVLVMGILVWGLFKKSEDPDFKMFTFSGMGSGAKPDSEAGASSSVPSPAGVMTSWGTVSLNLPAGCAIADTKVLPGRLIVLTRPQKEGVTGCARVTVIDSNTGRILGTVVGGP